MSTYSEALAFAAAYCSASEHCKTEILEKTAKFELNREEQCKLIERLVQEGFLNEKRYVRSFVNDRFRFNKWGRIKIRYMLKQKGISQKLIEEGLEQIQEEEYHELLLTLLKLKLPSIKSKTEYEMKGKILRYAAGKGFEPSLINSCLKEIKANVY